jgi:hypothetical protein
MVDGRDASTAHAVARKFRDWLRPKGPADQACARRALCAALSSVVSLLVGTTVVGVAAASGAPRFHLRGIARIDAHVARSHGKLVLSGTVTDDIGAPGPRARVMVQISTEPVGARHPTLVALAPTAPEPCSDAWAVPALEGADRLAVNTDGAARFCVRLALPPGRLRVHLEADGSGFVDGARIDLPVDLGLEPVTLRFDPERQDKRSGSTRKRRRSTSSQRRRTMGSPRQHRACR